MGDSSPTELYLPQHLDYPIKVLSLDARRNDEVQRGTRLLSYSFVYLPTASPDPLPQSRFGTWDSAIEGTLKVWNIKPGDVISSKKARDRPVVTILEPCKHGMQLGGLCVLCGKDMTNVDYTGFSDASRASIQMTHSAFGPTVSLEEAQRIERETAQHLFKARKLSLIVDLDQTIVHATVDPTVGEWIDEGEAWEARQAAKAKAAEGAAPSDDEDECNPNWEALKDVKRFRLGPESFGPPSLRGSSRNKGKNKMVETEGCMYYIKPRPGWQEFMRETATKYEMHVYTMGTRAYAEEVCAAIDPDGSIFGGRILSRDESGSLTQKSLQRLFPSDTSMVVIIDDRADVWEWSPNLLKVIPYDFFIGIGDINSSFLPKIEPLTPAHSTPPPKAAQSINGAGDDATATPPSVEEQEKAEQQTTAMLTQNNAALDAQLEERPLAKKEKELQEHEIEEQHHQQDKAQTPSPEATPTPSVEPPPKPEKVHKKALLKNDDYELQRVSKLLNEVHSRFFSAYDARSPEHVRRKTGPSGKAYDVTRIIPRLRSEVFEGVHILFSSVIPLDTVPEMTDIWRMARMFGARVSTELTGDITHVVAAKRGTVKVDMARKRGGIKIVWLAWFTDSIALWSRQDEKPYLLDDPPAPPSSMQSNQNSSSPITESAQLIDSSDLDIDSDDWDQDTQEVTGGGGGGAASSMLELEAINWDDINDEVEAAMNESDDESERSVGGPVMGGDASEDDWSDGTGSVNNTPRLKRKRLRSVTPSDGANGSGRDDEEYLRSPLSKRKKLAADRIGYSPLKEGISADQLTVEKGETANGGKSPNGSTPASSKTPTQETANEGNKSGNEAEEDDEEEEEDEEDDFLARELEEEWG
ncbi:hypothetical protein CPB84DRAFT_529609 [Gymnopilus junonius]|uniref:RNA polymerase II subunit A C-terminal domain phosphatase n=1 Tax=Gymnopilus junonius TaxID=109634 RepID=A0A9P5P152_GYMJU|nr:hypothetical protein CPB84DRAFT_529609 [Gymnopilus junonius]